jgi:hypothetical protein
MLRHEELLSADLPEFFRLDADSRLSRLVAF